MLSAKLRLRGIIPLGNSNHKRRRICFHGQPGRRDQSQSSKGITMYPGAWAQRTPEKAAAIDTGSGNSVSYRELDDRSNQLAQLL